MFVFKSIVALTIGALVSASPNAEVAPRAHHSVTVDVYSGATCNGDKQSFAWEGVVDSTCFVPKGTVMSYKTSGR